MADYEFPQAFHQTEIPEDIDAKLTRTRSRLRKGFENDKKMYK